MPRPSINSWFDSTIRIWRPSVSRDSLGVEQRTYVALETVGCRKNRSTTKMIETGGGMSPVGTLRWYGEPTIDVQVRDVCEVLTGPDSGRTWEVNELPVRPANHHTQVDCIEWSGELIEAAEDSGS